MIHHNNNGQEYLMVTMKEGASNPIIKEYKFGWHLAYDLGEYRKLLPLPPGQWQILFLASEATEEQAGEVVEQWDDSPQWKDYKYKSHHGETYFPYSTALESLRSLLSSHGMQGETLFIKRVK